ncbi:unnamed protein product [Rotaria sp. Silwood1]|nr:unnamed protein product [Rotaria sp. Silwood1]CAF1253159.1 unnamed protein product [Rotaria sp. Silwood1]CAF3485396.1 unnamed protein product [Rotaria sp. Silwood1]CAF4689489.1 unnamed protein product [Rotaria sp. Silwood1]CAF4706046.1 unnamed protein product [Rotaria sp. Silwood1]
MAQTLNRVLITITSVNVKFWPLGLKTSYFWTEVLHLYETFKNYGYEVGIVSETGTVGIDESSSIYAQIDRERAQLKKPDDVDPNKYVIIYYSGGHGAAVDFPKATGLQRIGSSIYQNGGVIAAVCHGPAIFTNLKVNNELLIKRKKVRTFHTSGEKLLMPTDRLKEHNLPFMEDLLRGLGADWQVIALENL